MKNQNKSDFETHWKIIEPDLKRNFGDRKFFICECKCGKKLSKRIDELKRTKQCKSCACKERDFSSLGNKLKDMTGCKIGNWIVLERDLSKKSPAHWKCKCKCGSIHIVRGSELRRGKSKKCKKCVDYRRFTHGMATKGKRAPEYNSWSQMNSRCYNPNDKRFKDYGGRGIYVFHKWKNSFIEFYKFVGQKTTSKHSIDRIDVNGHYEPGNVRWATPKEQANNRRKRI